MPINPPAPQAPYTGTRVTLTAANTLYNLWALVKAQRPNVPASARCVNVQIDAGSGANVYFGDGQMTATDYGYVLSANSGLANRYESDQGNVAWGYIFVMTDTNSTPINVEILGC